MLNTSIQKYINTLGMSMKCKFDEYFDEQMTDDRGSKLCYWSFSGGERKTIDIACSWAFKDIKRKISGISSNVEFLDEILDSAFDERGLDLLIEVIKERIDKDKLSSYAISHRKETMKHIDG
jgi:Fe-S cluster assembly ATPase SufC